MEIYYRRGETTHKGKVVAARVETVVLFLPDVWSCVPTRLEWDALHLNYKRHAERKLKALLQPSEADDPADEKAFNLSFLSLQRYDAPALRHLFFIYFSFLTTDI